MRVRKDGEIYSVLKQGGIPETTLQCNLGSSITFKVPIGITKIKIQYRKKGVMTTCIVSVSSENTYTVSSKGSSTDPFLCLYILYENSNEKDLYFVEAKEPVLTVKWSSAINNL